MKSVSKCRLLKILPIVLSVNNRYSTKTIWLEKYMCKDGYSNLLSDDKYFLVA